MLSQTNDSPREHSAGERELTIVELLLEYVRFAKSYYVKNGEPTDEMYGIRAAFRPLKDFFGHTMAAKFGPKDLKLVRQQMVESGHSRRYVNDNVNRIRRMFKWAVENEFVLVTTYQTLAAVSGLRKGRTEARDTRPVRPVDAVTVAATLEHLPQVIADMVTLQQLSGCRPGEVCVIRPCDVNCEGDVWTYRPMTHKNEHHGRDRTIFLGSRAQDVLRPYLVRADTDFCFSPAESEVKRNAQRRERRGSPMTPSQERRRPKKQRTRTPGKCYTKDSYRQAVQRACDRTFPIPDGMSEADVSVWRKEHRWSPNQLRHATGTDVRKRYGLEAAQVVLGHASADVSQIYAERDYALARKVMGEVG